MRRPRPLTGLLLLGLVLAAMRGVVACGDRTGLLVDGVPEPQDAAPDVRRVRDAVSEDAFEEDGLPPIDVRPKPDVIVNDCPDAAATLVYVVTAQNILYSFYPPTAAFTAIGVLSCPTPSPNWQPFSMAVDRKGTAYVLFSDGSGTAADGLLFRVSTATAACIPTSYQPGQQVGFARFGMGFVGSPDGKTDTLFVASDTTMGQLGSIDLTTFRLNVVGAFVPQTVSTAELTGTGDGRLFAFYATSPGSLNESSAVAQIDPRTAMVLANDDLSSLRQGGGWAFAFWGGDFYLFTAPGGPLSSSQVTRFSPSDGSQAVIVTMADTITGAGVSTCAPQQ